MRFLSYSLFLGCLLVLLRYSSSSSSSCYYYSPFESFSQQRQLMVSHWILGDSKSPNVSRTLLSILANLNNAVVLMISTCPLIFISSSPFTNPLGIVPGAPATIGINVTFMAFSFFLILKHGLGTYPSFCFLLFSVCCPQGRQSPLFVWFSFLFFFLFYRLSLGPLVWPRLGSYLKILDYY